MENPIFKNTCNKNPVLKVHIGNPLCRKTNENTSHNHESWLNGSVAAYGSGDPGLNLS